MRPLRVSFAVAALASAIACIAGSASEQDCDALGDKFVELFIAEQTEDARKLGPEVLDAAAATGREEVAAACKAKSTPKATIKRCLAVTTMAEFRAC